MEEYNPRIPVQPESFRQDRIKLDYGDWYVEGTEELLGEFFEGLYPPTEIAEDLEEQEGWIFNAPSGGTQNPNYYSIRKRTSVQYPAPLFGGKLVVQDGEQQREYDPTLRNGRILKYRLFLNPTRFVKFQRVPANYHESFSEWVLHPNFRRLLTRHVMEGIPQRCRERSLDGNNNYLNTYLEPFARNEVWMDLVRFYLDSLFELLNNELWRVAGQIDHNPDSLQSSSENEVNVFFHSTRRNPGRGRGRTRTVRAEPLYYLNEYETYIDFSPPVGFGAVDYVNELIPILSQYRAGSVERFRIGDAESYGLSFEYSAGVRFKLYAKTPIRIRVEIAFNLASRNRSCASLLHDDGRRARSTQSIDVLMEWFSRLDSVASDAVNEVFEFLSGRIDYLPNRPSYSLPIRIMGVLGNERESSLVMALLVSNGSITLRRRNDPLRPIVTALEGAGVLNRNGENGNSCFTYTVSEIYQSSLEQLRN